MATYKLIQDIEAEDHILGPLSLRQFIFALIAVFLFYLCYLSVSKNALFLLAILLPPALFCGFFAVPFGRDQPTETWALAKLRFWFKPRRRIWNQSGVKELVTITVPKKVERVLTNGLSQNEVKSRLQALANTIDSHGWAIKNVNIDAYNAQPVVGGGSDRLIDINDMPRPVSSNDLSASDDILDAANNPIARQFDDMIDESSRSHRQQLIDELNDIRKEEAASQAAAAGPAPAPVPAYNWFTGQPSQPAAAAPPVAADVPAAANDDALSAQLAARANSQQASFGNLRTVQPLAARAAAAANPANGGVAGDGMAAGQTDADDQSSAVTAPSDPAILSLAKNNDLNVATLAREARKNRDDEQQQNEVVVTLH